MTVGTVEFFFSKSHVKSTGVSRSWPNKFGTSNTYFPFTSLSCLFTSFTAIACEKYIQIRFNRIQVRKVAMNLVRKFFLESFCGFLPSWVASRAIASWTRFTFSPRQYRGRVSSTLIYASSVQDWYYPSNDRWNWFGNP